MWATKARPRMTPAGLIFFWMGEKFPTVLRPLTPPGLIAASPERDNQNDQFVTPSKKQGQTAGLFPLAFEIVSA